MGSTLFKDLFNEMESGSFTSSIPAGTYDVVVTDARTGRKNDGSEPSVIFVTLQVLDGPAAGKSTELNLYVPKDGDKPFAFTSFKKKMFGFSAYPDVKAAFESSVNAPSREALLDLFAGAVVGKKVKAEISLRGSDAGQYAGSNELTATTRPEGGVAGQPTPTAVEAPAGNGQTSVAAPF